MPNLEEVSDERPGSRAGRILFDVLVEIVNVERDEDDNENSDNSKHCTGTLLTPLDLLLWQPLSLALPVINGAAENLCRILYIIARHEHGRTTFLQHHGAEIYQNIQ